MRGPTLILACLTFFIVIAFATGQSQSPSQPAQKIPAIDGGIGPCSLLLTVLTPEGKPVLGADVKVHIAYGFGGFHKLDLEAYTNADGKLKFTGLPSRVHQPPLTFQASKDDRAGIATYDPAVECDAQHDLPLNRQKSAQ
jgi:hypothetical protein